MDIDQLAADTIRVLSMDGVQRANSGHPGMPMGMADIAVVLWTRHLLVDPTDPTWPDRDRFILSNGHGSMLLYSLLHLAGFSMTMDDLMSFRQWGSVAPGHPERDPMRGIEMTTGPLGQGFGTAVGMAMAEAHLRAVFGPDLIDHHTYVFVGDGDLMEGISSEAASLAGRLGLGKLIYLYDDNHISIEGDTDLAFREDVPARFSSLGWHVAAVDGHDRSAIDEAIVVAKADPRPSLIACRTHIAYGAPTKHDSADSHGSPLGESEIAGAKKAMGWELPPFEVPADVYQLFRRAMERGATARRAWESRRDQWVEGDPGHKTQWTAHWDPAPIDISDVRFEPGSAMATRKASGVVINAIASRAPTLIGGSADLAPSTNTMIKDSPDFQDDPAGRNIHFGVREHAMGAAVNGMAVHGGLRPFGATFFVFNDYMRPATRLAALMEAPSIFVYTHDSVFLGEDGPTHQPIEQLASLRAMPGMWVIRPADATETADAWAVAMARTNGPTCVVLTRQDLPVLDRGDGVGGVERGGYVLRPGEDAVLVATGSEVSLALEAAELLAGRGIGLRVVSLPCWEAFFAQDDAYRASVLGVGIPRASLEAAATFGWERVVGGNGLMIGIDRFGASAPAARLAEEFGFTPAAVADRIVGWLASV